MLASLIRFYRYSPALVPAAMTHAPDVGPPLVLARYDERQTRLDVLLENGGARSTDCDWEIVCVIASPVADEPLDPLTMARNMLAKPGGTPCGYTADAFAEAVWYWSRRARIVDLAADALFAIRQVFTEGISLLDNPGHENLLVLARTGGPTPPPPAAALAAGQARWGIEFDTLAARLRTVPAAAR
mgnify:CR=1 FL=1